MDLIFYVVGLTFIMAFTFIGLKYAIFGLINLIFSVSFLSFCLGGITQVVGLDGASAVTITHTGDFVILLPFMLIILNTLIFVNKMR